MPVLWMRKLAQRNKVTYSRNSRATVLLAFDLSAMHSDLSHIFFFKILFIFRDRRGGRKRGRETSMCGCLLHASYWGPALKPRHMP